MKKLKERLKRGLAMMMAAASIVSVLPSMNVSAASETAKITFAYCHDGAGNTIKYQQTVTHDGRVCGEAGDARTRIGSMSILWTKKVERLCCFFEFLILLLLGCHITNCTMDSFAVIPALYIFKDCPTGLFGILISMKINFFLFQYGMERFDTGIIVWISFTAE